MKFCVGCNLEKFVDEFHKNKSVPGGYSTRCKMCSYESNKKWIKENPEKQKAQWLRNRYGLTLEKYYELIARGCFICGEINNLQIDHDHACCSDRNKTCGKCVRGILCGRHNRLLSLARDSIDELDAAAKYLKLFNVM